MKTKPLKIIFPLLTLLLLALPKTLFCYNDNFEIPDAGAACIVFPANLDLIGATGKIGLYSYKSYPRPYIEAGALYLLSEEDREVEGKDWLWLIAGGLWFSLPIDFPSEMRIGGGYLSTEQENIRYYIEFGHSFGLFEGFELTIIIGYGTLFSPTNTGRVHSSIELVKENIFDW